MINEKMILKMSNSIAKELGIFNLQLNKIQKFQLESVYKDMIPQWKLMSHEKCYEDVYKTIYCLKEMWSKKEI